MPQVYSDIHLIWLDSPVPEWAKRNIREFSRLNPDRNIVLHIDSYSLLDVYRPIYETLKLPCQKADLLRYSVLEVYGGWYFDIDFWPKVSVETLETEYNINEDTFFLTEFTNPRNPISNAVIYSKPHHPHWDVIKKAVLKADNRCRNSYGPDILRGLNHSKALEFRLGKAEQFYIEDSEYFVHGIKEE